MRIKLSLSAAFGFVLLFGLAAAAFGDTVRLKDGTVVRGQIIGFRDQQFTVLMGSGDRGRRSRMMIYIEDVESIEFDAAASEISSAAPSPTTTTTTTTAAPSNQQPPPRQQSPQQEARQSPTTQQPPTSTVASNQPSAAATRPTQPGASPFFQVNIRVRADSTTNGWTNTGLVVRRGQRLRMIASGRVSLGQGRFSTPVGVTTLSDKGKLMPNEATGALIAVIGDDNDDFILVGNRRELVAQRDGVLFLGVNEGELGDNTGNFDVTIEAETASRAAR